MLKIENSVLLMIDIQGKLSQIVDESDQLLKKASIALKAAKLLDLPILVCEQTPEKLGKTAEFLQEDIKDLKIYEKHVFSAARQEELMNDLNALDRSQVIIIGIETHICVYQSIYDLLASNYDVYVLEDVVSSRSKDDKNCGIDRVKALGAKVVTLEMALFELMETAKHPSFRAISKLIK